MKRNLALTILALLTSFASFALSGITGPSSICAGSSVTLMDSTTGGTWSSGTPAVASVGSISGVVTGISAGVDVITYTVGTSHVTMSITVNPLPSITGPTTVTLGGTIPLSATPSGGSWSSSCITILTVSGTGTVTGVAVGPCSVNYTTTAGCMASHPDTVVPSGSILPVSGPNHVCVGSTISLMDSTSGGYWISGNTGIATVGSTTGVVTGLSTGAVNISYIVGVSSVYTTITVNPLPAYITGPTTVSAGGSITLTDGTTGGTWSSGCPSTMTINATSGLLTGVTAGSCFITYTLPTGCFRTYSDTVTGTGGTTLPITGASHVCVGSTVTLMDSTSGGTWSSSNTSVATVGATTGVVTGVAAGVCTITYTHGTSVATLSFTVNPMPAYITGPGTVGVGGTITAIDGTSGGTWSSSNTAVATVGVSSGIVTGVSAGFVWITYTLPSGCYRSTLDTVTGGGSVLPIAGITHVCSGSTVTLFDSTSGGTWTSSNPGIATVGATTGVVTGVSAGTCTISYTVGTSTATVAFTVFASPAPITGPTTVSVGGLITLADGTGGGVWSSGNTAIATVTASGIVTGVAPGTVNIYYALTTGCGTYHTVTVSGVSVNPITGTFSTCIGSTTTLHDTTTGGSWSSSNTAVATVGATTGVVTGVSAGVCTITYTVGTSYATHSFTVNPIPAAPSGPSTVAAGSTITLTDAGGGTWYSGNTAIATVNATTGVVTGVTAGSVYIYYLLPSGCTNYKIITVTGGTGILPISGVFSVCAGNTTTLHDSTTGGTWSSSNTAIATVNATSGLVTGVAAGTCTITYTVGTSYVTASFTVYAMPGAISGPASVSAGSTIVLTDATTGGTWSSSNTSVATVNATTGVVTGVSAGTCTIYYSVGTGCSVSHTVTVSGGGTLTPISGTFHACIGSSSTLHDSTTGGVWTSSNTAIATVVSSTGVVTGVAAGVCTITYTVGTSYTTASFTVSALPSSITGPTTVAVGSTITLTDGTTGGTWASGNTSIASVNSVTGVVTGVTSGVVNIYYTTPGGCGVYYTITVTGSGILPITGTLHTCIGSTVMLHDSTTGGTWSSSNPAIATVGSSTGVVTGVSAGTCTISYTFGGTTVTATFTVYAAPAPIAGSSSVCIGTTITLTDATPGGTWSSGSTMVATVGASTGVVTGDSFGVVNIYYTLTTGCSAYKTVTVNYGPSPIAGSSTVCIGSTVALTDATPGGTWTSVYTAFATVGSASGIVTGVAAGTATIVYNTGGCSVSKTITVNAAPAAITGSSTVCVGSAITLSDPTPGGSWTSGSTAVATVSTGGLVTGASAGVVNIYYGIGGCTAYHTVTVNPVPSTISGPSTVHTSGAPITLTDAVPGGSWFSGNTSLATVGALSGIVTGVSAGTVNIFYSIGGCAVYKTITVMSPAPPAYNDGSNSGDVTTSDASATELTAPATEGIATVKQANNFTLYPNPTTGRLNIEWTNLESGAATVTVSDVVGHEVLKSVLNINSESGTSQVDCSNFNDGMYIISIKSESATFSSRIMVRH